MKIQINDSLKDDKRNSAIHIPVVNGCEIKADGKVYWGIGLNEVIFLIPKKRGKGFLKQPVGHHVNKLSRIIAELGYDCSGLDGYLCVWTGFTHGNDYSFLASEISRYCEAEIVEVTPRQILKYCLNSGHCR